LKSEIKHLKEMAESNAGVREGEKKLREQLQKNESLLEEEAAKVIGLEREIESLKSLSVEWARLQQQSSAWFGKPVGTMGEFGGHLAEMQHAVLQNSAAAAAAAVAEESKSHAKALEGMAAQVRSANAKREAAEKQLDDESAARYSAEAKVVVAESERNILLAMKSSLDDEVKQVTAERDQALEERDSTAAKLLGHMKACDVSSLVASATGAEVETGCADFANTVATTTDTLSAENNFEETGSASQFSEEPVSDPFGFTEE
jgi:hypothetical protein